MRWEEKPLGSLVESRNGLWKGKEGATVLAAVYRAANFTKDCRIKEESEPAMIQVEQRQLQTRQLIKGDILIEKSGGGPNQPVGRAVLFDNETEAFPSSFSNFTTRLRVSDQSRVLPNYLQKFLFSFYLSGGTESLQSNSTNIRNLQLKKYLDVSIPIPPLEEQERIVEVLDEAFAAIDMAKANIERNLTNARELFQSRLNDIFSNPSVDWEVKPLGEAFKFQGGTQPPKSKFIFEPKDGYVRLLQIRDFSREDKKVFIPEESSNRRCNAEDILIGRYGASVGKICSGLAGAFNVALVKVIPRIEVDHRFSQFYFKSPEFQRPLSGVSSRGAQDGFNVEGIRNFLFPSPPLEEQERIVIELDSLDEMKRGLEAKYQSELNNLEELRQSILEQAFEGKLTEPVAA